jgi:hypothetical protein
LACGALSPLSPLPGQLAALCARLNLSGHGITAPPAHELPELWLSVLTQYQQRQTSAALVHDGFAAGAIALPELDGIQLAILGVHNCEDSTILHMHASGLACHTAYESNGPYSWPPLWIRDSGSHWHVTRISGHSEQNGEMALRLEIVPPLSHKTAWIEVLASGRSTQTRTRLPLRWQ